MNCGETPFSGHGNCVDTTRNNELRILIADALPEDRLLLRQQLPDLPELKFVFEEACSGGEAVEKLERSWREAGESGLPMHSA
jgi:hypothetical protein